MEKLMPWWPDCSHGISCHNLRAGLKKWKQMDAGTEDSLYLIKIMPVRSPMTNFRMTVRADCTVSACSPLLQPRKSRAHWLSVAGELAFGQVFPHHPWLLASKQTCHCRVLASLSAVERRAAGPGIGYTLNVPNRHFHMKSKKIASIAQGNVVPQAVFLFPPQLAFS